jgi:hypothetical protein
MTGLPASTGPAVAAVGERLLRRVDELANELTELIARTEPHYRGDAAVPTGDLHGSVRDNLGHILSRFAGRPTPGLEPARATGRRRAEQGVPLAVILHSYRIAGKFLWAAILAEAEAAGGSPAALLDAASDLWFIIDELSGVVTASYRDTLDELARRSQQTRNAMLDVLLRGDGDRSRLWEYTAALRLPRQGTFVVAAAQTPQPGVEAIGSPEETLNRRGVRSAWRIEVEAQIGVLVLGPPTSIASVAEELASRAAGAVGLSEPYTQLDQTPGALREARLALLAADPPARPVVRYGEVPVAVLLLSAPDAADALARAVLGPVLDLPDAECDSILRTLREWFAVDGATSIAAEKLHMHRNTVRYRLRRLEELTGRSLAQPSGLADLHLALEAVRVLRLGGTAST